MNVRVYADDPAGIARLDVLPHRLNRGALPALEAHLHDPLGAGCGVPHHTTLANVVGERFLQVNIHTAFKCCEKLERVPVWRTGDDDSIEFRHGEQFLVQLEHLRSGALEFLDFISALRQVVAIGVAERIHHHAPHLQRGFGIHQAVAAASYDSEAQFGSFGGSTGSVLRGEGRHVSESHCGGAGSGQEAAARDRMHLRIMD